MVYKLFITSTSLPTGSISPNSPATVIDATTGLEREPTAKEKIYIANAQGYVLEFRLSENTVSNFEEYKTEVARYAGMSWDELIAAERNGTYEGWLPLKDFLCKEGIYYDWGGYIFSEQKTQDEIACAAVKFLIDNDARNVICGTLTGVDQGDHGGSGVYPEESGGCPWYVGWDQPRFFHDMSWPQAGLQKYNNDWSNHILLGRPL